MAKIGVHIFTMLSADARKHLELAKSGHSSSSDRRCHMSTKLVVCASGMLIVHWDLARYHAPHPPRAIQSLTAENHHHLHGILDGDEHVPKGVEVIAVEED